MHYEEAFHSIYHNEPSGVVFCPYRVCPIGAHSDHQYGKITGFAIDKGIHIAYHPKQNGVVELAGPEKIPLDELARLHLAAKGDSRRVIADVHARYFGTELDDRSLTPGETPLLGSIRFEDWLRRSSAQA